MSKLNGEALREIAVQVFQERSLTLSEAGNRYDLDEMAGTIRAFRRLMRSTLEGLPESAFAAQPPGEGETHWSAGQVIAHLANSQASMTGTVRSLLGLPAAAESQRHEVDAILPTRDEALTILTDLQAGFDAFVEGIPADADLTASMTHERFGDMSSNGWMMLMALHEGDHLRQIQALGA